MALTTRWQHAAKLKIEQNYLFNLLFNIRNKTNKWCVIFHFSFHPLFIFILLKFIETDKKQQSFPEAYQSGRMHVLYSKFVYACVCASQCGCTVNTFPPHSSHWLWHLQRALCQYCFRAIIFRLNKIVEVLYKQKWKDVSLSGSVKQRYVKDFALNVHIQQLWQRRQIRDRNEHELLSFIYKMKIILSPWYCISLKGYTLSSTFKYMDITGPFYSHKTTLLILQNERCPDRQVDRNLGKLLILNCTK